MIGHQASRLSRCGRPTDIQNPLPLASCAPSVQGPPGFSHPDVAVGIGAVVWFISAFSHFGQALQGSPAPAQATP